MGQTTRQRLRAVEQWQESQLNRDFGRILKSSMYTEALKCRRDDERI